MVLNETQQDRDIELSSILGVPYDDIFKLEIASPDSIRIFKGDIVPIEERDINNLYTNYPFLNLEAYLKTLMYTSVKRRGPILRTILMETTNSKCLDFGSGVGTHVIALLENINTVDILDVDGPLRDFTQKRIKRRGFKVKILNNDTILMPNRYDLVICTDVLEHVYDPVSDLKRMYITLKFGGHLFLEVSKMVKPSSGHFKQNIDNWKKEGIPFLKKNFKETKKGVYTKI